MVSFENYCFFLLNNYFGDHSCSINSMNQKLQNMQNQFDEIYTNCTNGLHYIDDDLYLIEHKSRFESWVPWVIGCGCHPNTQLESCIPLVDTLSEVDIALSWQQFG